MFCNGRVRWPRGARTEGSRRRRVPRNAEALRNSEYGTECRTTLRGAFTLVELMVVVVIIGLLAGVVTFSVRSYLVASKQNLAKMEIAKICQALETYYTANDRHPSNEEGLAALTEPSRQFPDGLLNRVPKDPWGHGYQYNSPGRTGAFEVVCYGADGREGGEGADRDISSADLDEESQDVAGRL